MRGSEWAPLYLLVVLAIAAILLVTFVKPMFRQASVEAEKNSQEARDAAKSLAPVLLWPAGLGIGRRKAKTVQNSLETTKPKSTARAMHHRLVESPFFGGI